MALLTSTRRGESSSMPQRRKSPSGVGLETSDSWWEKSLLGRLNGFVSGHFYIMERSGKN